MADKSEGILLGGDFNLPGWNWKDKQLKEDCKYPSLHSMFGEMLDDRFLTQVIELPTREHNCLDLICTNTPTKILNTDVIPGISDHDIPLVELHGCETRKEEAETKKDSPLQESEVGCYGKRTPVSSEPNERKRTGS